MRARGKETRQAILRAAEQQFAERGYAGARMDDVATEVGIKRASMVYYFRDKRSLYLALLDDLFGGLLPKYQAALVEGANARDRILACLDIWVNAVVERPGLMRIMMWESARVRRASAEPLAEEIAPILSTVAEGIVVGQADGTFLPIEPLRFMMIVTGATAFLTLGMHVLASDSMPLSAIDLREELRTLVKRVLFVD
jgi:TetR/AcrR family transcriptional regulator